MTKDEQDQGRRGTCETCPAWIQRRVRQGWGVCHLGPPTAGIDTSRPITTGDDWCMSHPERQKALAVPTWPVTTHIVSEQSQLDLAASALAGRPVNVRVTPKRFDPASALAQKPVGADGTPVDVRVTDTTTVYPDPMHETDPKRVPLGLYRVHWKKGGASLAAIGQASDGSRWIAPTNWTWSWGLTYTWSDIAWLEPIPEPVPLGAKPFPFVLQVNDTPIATIGYDPATGEFEVTMPPAETKVD